MKKKKTDNIVDIDAKNKVNVFVQKNLGFVSEIMKARKTDIHTVYDIKRKIVDLKLDKKLTDEKRNSLIKEEKAKLAKAKKAARASQNVIKQTVDKALKEKFFDLKVCFSYEQVKYQAYLDELKPLRQDGENKIIALRSEIQDIILNKQIDKETKKKLVTTNREELKKAKAIAKINKLEVNAIVKEAMAHSRADFKQYFRLMKASIKSDKTETKKIYKQMVETFAMGHKKRIEEIHNRGGDKKVQAVDIKAENVAYSSKINEAKTARNEGYDNAKALRYNTFLNKYNYTAKLKHDKHPLSEWIQNKFEHYIANFNAKNWLLKNALYVVIILVFIIIACLPQASGLLTGKNILGAFVQISPKIFYALGVAGLILLGGTDLSIGRLTGVGVAFSLMILSKYTYTDQVLDLAWWPFAATAPAAVKVLMAILVSVFVCTLFTTFAGFFTAKFKMHPFISTLSVQLISYGFFQIFWSATSSFTPDNDILKVLRGGDSSFLLIIYAAIAIAVVWFIWNKTRFGKNMYAVGGNQEAATVSGISPFKITILAFVMAGILYGFGGFVQAIQTGTGNFNSGYGTETDAIAACVIGGISFSGGVGKVGGAVIGAIILGFLTYAFAYAGINSNLQLLIKGVIILVAVALDCVKYLRKK